MSASWHRDRNPLRARSQGGFGFYDSAYQIAVLPQEEVPPHLVVDHEITHVNLVMHSSIGLLERILVWVEWTAHLNARSDVVTNVRALTDAILAATEVVHEAAAWFGTELQSEGHEDIKAPPTYAGEVNRLRRMFAGMPDTPSAVLSKVLPQVLEVADSIAIYALSPPLMRTLALQPDLISPDTLTTSLARKSDNPLSRFRELCSRLESVPFPKAVEWARAVGIDGRGARPGAESERVVPSGRATFSIFARRDDLPVSFRSDLYKLGTGRFARALATHVGLLGSAPLRLYGDRPAIAQPDDDAVLKAFASFDVTHGYVPELDRYSQVCVLETWRVWRDLVYEDTPDRVTAALGARPYLMLGVIPPVESAGFARAPEHITDIIVTAPHQGADPEGDPLRPTWRVDVATASPFLASYGWRNPILASSVGYDFGAGDYNGVKLLRDVPHVVVTIRDFRSLWFGIGGRRGLRDCRAIEWMPMPSPSGHAYVGFLLLKPADNPFPIVVNPTLVSEYKRAVTVADRWASTSGVGLVEHRGNPYAWLGPMTHAVMTAAAVFEMDASPEAVQLAALEYQMRETKSRLGL